MDEWEMAVREAAQGAVSDRAKDADQMFARLGRQYRGRPVTTIRPVLQREWSRVMAGSLSEPELTDYARLISEGTAVHFKVGTSTLY